MPQFVILQHDAPGGRHFDFMLEASGVLKTWQLPEPPRPGVAIKCQALIDHRLAYLDYEGPVSGDRGSVTRLDRGEYTTEQHTETLWTVRIAGNQIVGLATLRRLSETSTRWQFELVGGS
jgi:hypothetical protein